MRICSKLKLGKREAGEREVNKGAAGATDWTTVLRSREAACARRALYYRVSGLIFLLLGIVADDLIS